MATEAAPHLNGLYGNQYSQPAELAASTPSATAHGQSASLSSTAASTTGAAKADPQEIGWYFVEQYYTTLSKSPEKIHLFYNKKSQLVTGVEAEKVVPVVGTKAIGEKIKSLEIQDCKVRVLNVDSQASFQNIVVQVIGEMSNKSEPHHKFVQTFVLAEQPNGYFVLNDIFRYLNNDEDEIVEDETVDQDVAAEEHIGAAAAPVQDEVAEAVDNEEAAEVVDAKLEDLKAGEGEAEVADEEEEGDAEPATNGVAAEHSGDESAQAADVAETTANITEEPAASVLAGEQPSEPEPTPIASPPKSQTPAPAPDAAPVKKTWASMVGTKALAVPALPIASAPTPAPSQPKAQKPVQPSPAPKASATEPAEPAPTEGQSNGFQTVEHSKKQNRPQTKAPAEQNTLAYIKNVNEKVDARLLKEVLEAFGELKYYDVSRPRNCAFVEFADAGGYNAAVAANPHTVGTEQIYVEERRPRPTAYGGANAAFARGGAVAGRGRGGMQQRTGSQGSNGPRDAAPRGGFQQRGVKSGNVTPRGGRGQAVPV